MAAGRYRVNWTIDERLRSVPAPHVPDEGMEEPTGEKTAVFQRKGEGAAGE